MENNLANNKLDMVTQHTYENGRFFKRGTVLGLATLVLLSACGGGAESESRPPVDEGEPPAFTGKLLSDDAKAFKKELYDKISPSNICGGCHRSDAPAGKRQSPYFVDWADPNFAYKEVVERTPPLVDLANPASSILVQRVAGGHQCWLGSSSDCAAAMTQYITNWADSSKKGVTEVEFTIYPPTSTNPPGDSKFFPTTTPSGYGTTTLHTLVRAHCSGCHNSAVGGSAQSPFFADDDVDSAYQGIKQVVNLNDPADSRVYHRLVAEHNCWSTCTNDAIEMRTAIENFASGIAAIPYDLTTDAVSYALKMVDGTEAASYNRYESDQIALFEFKFDKDNPTIIRDTSGVEPAINLTLLDDNHRWLGNWGIEFTTSRGASATVDDSRKLFNLIRLSGEYTLEAWVIPANVNQEDTSIVAYSGDSVDRNIAMGQTMYNYDFYNRSSTTDGVGSPKLMTDPDDEDLQATLQHVVMTYDQENGRQVFVNGASTGDVDPEAPGDLLNWHSSYALWLGNEADNKTGWDGILRLVAFHDRALTLEQIQQNYLAEVGQKFQVPFDVSHIINDGVPHSYIVFEVSQFDEYSYLFRNPRFINIDPATPDYVPQANIKLSGMRIGMNGQLINVGQAYNNISITDLADGYTPETGKILSTVDTVIQIQNGIALDEFFLTFDEFNGKSFAFSEVDKLDPPLLPGVPANKPSDIGIRTFDSINASMASMTGLDTAWAGIPAINDVFTSYRKQLPAVANIEAFQGSHQMAIAQLAMAYCSYLVENVPAYFTGFDFAAPVATAFSPATKLDNIINPLLSNIFNASKLGVDDDPVDNLETQPSVKEVRDELTWLMIGDGATRGNGMVGATPCSTATTECLARTQNIVKAACASALGSAAMLIQ